MSRLTRIQRVCATIFIGFLAACGGSSGGGTGSISGTIDPGKTQPSSIPNGVHVVAGDVIVKFRGDLSLQRVQSLSVQGVTLNRVRGLFNGIELYHVAGVSEAKTQQVVTALEARPDVAWAEANQIFYPALEPNDTFYGAQWHYKAMNLPAAWDITTGTPGTVVAVVDTGILWNGDNSPLTHPDFKGKVLPGFDFISDPTKSNDGDGRDSNAFDPGDEPGGQSSYHGSHVAGTIAAATNNSFGVAGVNWAAKILPVRVLGVGGGTTVDIAEGTAWAAGISISGAPNNPTPAKTINLSIQGQGTCSNLYQQAFDLAVGAGATVVIAAGNRNVDVSDSPPANCDNIIAVGATDQNGKRAPYSNFGSGIDIMAPGGDTSAVFTFQGKQFQAGVLSTLKDDGSGQFNFVFYQGTSMAAPHVAGLVSLMKGKDPSLTPAQILTKLKFASTPLNAAQCNRPVTTDCGAGSVDAAKALGAVSTPAPVLPPSTSVKTYVIGLFQSGGINSSTFDETKSEYLEGNISTVTPYTLPNLEVGFYTVVGLTDLNGNRNFDSGEPAGLLTNVPVQVGKNTQNANVRLEPLQLQSTSVKPKLSDGMVQAINHVMQR